MLVSGRGLPRRNTQLGQLKRIPRTGPNESLIGSRFELSRLKPYDDSQQNKLKGK